MVQPRFSIVGLTGLVLTFAIAAAALRAESSVWSGMLFLLDFAVLGFATLAVVHRRGASRAWWGGFALFGWGYLAIAFGPWAADSIAPRLATSMLMDSLYTRYGPPPRPAGRGRIHRLGGSLAAQQRRLEAATKGVSVLFQKRHTLTDDQRDELYAFRDLLDPEKRDIVESEQTKLLQNGLIRSSAKDFRQTGHSLIVLLAACLGGISARVLHEAAGDAITVPGE